MQFFVCILLRTLYDSRMNSWYVSLLAAFVLELFYSSRHVCLESMSDVAGLTGVLGLTGVSGSTEHEGGSGSSWHRGRASGS